MQYVGGVNVTGPESLTSYHNHGTNQYQGDGDGTGVYSNYVAIALSIYRAEPSLKQLVAQTVYRRKQSICLELDVDSDMLDLIVIPSTYYNNIIHGKFWVSASLLTLSTGLIKVLPMTLHDQWPTYPFCTTILRSQWSMQNGSAHGRIGLCTPTSAANPAYRLRYCVQ